MVQSMRYASVLSFAGLLTAVSGCGGGGDDQPTADSSVVVDVDGQVASPDGSVVTPDAQVVLGERMTVTAVGVMIPAGSEQEWCEVVQLPNSAEVRAYKIRVSIDANVSHHAIVHAIQPGGTPQTNPWNSAPVGYKLQGGGCSIPGSANPILIGTQKPELEVTFPTDVYYPIAPGQKLLLNYHYVNASANPIPVQMRVDIDHSDTVRNIRAGSLFYNWTSFQPIGAGMQSTQSKTCAPFASPVSILTLNGHQHKMGTKFEAWVMNGTNQTPIYTNTDWDNPLYKVYDPILQIAAGESLKFECSWMNTTSSSLQFGVQAKDEMCILGGYIYPSNALTVECGR